MCQQQRASGGFLLLLALHAVVVLVCAQLPEPNCNSNRYEGNEVWSAVVNSIGQGAGEFWWGVKAPAEEWAPVSWIDMCAKRLETCQADIQVPGSMTGYKPTCVCDMWSCLHRQPPPVPSEVDTEVADALRPTCHFVKPQLLSFYCEAARYVNATCSDPAYVPLPPDGSCPALPPEGFTFDDIPGDGIRIPNGYQGLLWYNMYMLDGDAYQIQNGFYAGVISSPNVAMNGYGYPATISAPDGGLLTLNSLWATSAWDQDNVLTLTANDERGSTVGQFVTSLSTDEPREIDLAAQWPPGVLTGTFAGVKAVTVSTSGTQVALDNVHITLAAETGREIVSPPVHNLEFWPAPPGASSPLRKKHTASPLDDDAGEDSYENDVDASTLLPMVEGEEQLQWRRDAGG